MLKIKYTSHIFLYNTINVVLAFHRCSQPPVFLPKKISYIVVDFPKKKIKMKKAHSKKVVMC
jgi:hypothetical protein